MCCSTCHGMAMAISFAHTVILLIFVTRFFAPPFDGMGWRISLLTYREDVHSVCLSYFKTSQTLIYPETTNCNGDVLVWCVHSCTLRRSCTYRRGAFCVARSRGWALRRPEIRNGRRWDSHALLYMWHKCLGIFHRESGKTTMNRLWFMWDN